jgi:hypothetical protein
MQGSVMITAPTVGPVASTTANLTDYRYRPNVTERTILPDSTHRAEGALPLNDDRQDQGLVVDAEYVDNDPSAMFAAAVISGALSPTPKTMDELIMRIGTSTIPDEFEGRLKDLTA